MPATFIDSYSCQQLDPVLAHGQKPEFITAKLVSSVTYARGTVLGQITATGLFRNYTSGAVDGSQIPKALLAMDCVVDGSGNISIGGASQDALSQTAPAYSGGDFRCAELVGFDAAGLTNSGWKLLFGDVSTGVLRIQ